MTNGEFIRRTLGVKWVNRACSFDALDCWGLIVLYYKEVLNIELPTVQGYESKGVNIDDGYEQNINLWTNIKKPVNGAMVVFYIGNKAAHVGIVIDNKILHARGDVKVNGRVELHSIRAVQSQFTKSKFFMFTGDECQS